MSETRGAGPWRPVREIAKSFLTGEIEPIEAAVALAAYAHDDHPADAEEPFLTLIAIASETDAIPVGRRRLLWHPDVRVAEDLKHDQAQAWARPLVEVACRKLLRALPTE